MLCYLQMINGTQKKSTAPVAKQIVTPSVKEEVSHLVKQEETPSSITSSSEEESSSYPCTKCWKVFQSPVMLRRHDNSVHQSLLATNIKWYKCPVGDCKFITNTVSGILKTHCARVHSDVDVTKWKEEPNLIDTVEMAAGIGSGIKVIDEALLVVAVDKFGNQYKCILLLTEMLNIKLFCFCQKKGRDIH